ncbi:hypothetical protein BGW36DRAFT_12497 [Talaromyces proteolyticus]|uniref:Nephrocystin 3-like N-terminal domain-containing protein n=1 Tax=Talaromyces proteolyticus TaxID=1131652 RepID=A0AAD4Q670_9EURO|nr:uncharacterized protein BGW36DRAFT_12497 [Talaromyces proteolyticus]KAH8705386.1 hypothetical protein BGW36DRAFT_12497 [Talaromyces proteolyticus]
MLTDPRDDKANTISEFGERVEGTCTWIKENKSYQAWYQEQGSKLLWICGPPATGKTYMSIFLTDELEKAIKTESSMENDSELLVFYFCSAQNNKRSTGIALLRGLIYMVLLQKPKLVDYILDDFIQFKQHNGLFAPSNREALWRNFEKILQKIDTRKIYFVLDALDECEKHSLEWLLQKLTGLFSSNTQPPKTILKIIITSRQLPEVLSVYLSQFPHVNVNSGEKYLEYDLKLFISSKIKSLADAKSSIEKDENKRAKLRIKWLLATQPLTSYTNETFLWISFIIRDLRKALLTEVPQMLEKLPRGLDNYYERILYQILELGEAKSLTAALIIRWVAMVRRPLSLVELSAATDTLPTQTHSQEEVMNDHISLCGYFLKVDNGVVHLIHQSAKDYLRSNILKKRGHPLSQFHIVETDVDFQIAQTCLKYIQGKFERGGPYENGREYTLSPKLFCTELEEFQRFPLPGYSTNWWPEHARRSKKDNALLNLSFFSSDSSTRQAWIHSYWRTNMPKWQTPGTSFNLIHFSSFFGLKLIARSIVSSNSLTKRTLHDTVNSKSIHDMSPLHWAVRNGHHSVAKLLIDYGADLNARGYGLPPLIWAVRNGHKKLAKMLLDHSAEIDKMGYGLMALHWASWEGQEGMVQLLLDHGAEISATTLSQSVVPLDMSAAKCCAMLYYLYRIRHKIPEGAAIFDIDNRYIERGLKTIMDLPYYYNKDKHGEFPWSTVQEANIVSKLAREEELLSSKEFKRFIVCLACGMTILSTLTTASEFYPNITDDLNSKAPPHERQFGWREAICVCYFGIQSISTPDIFRSFPDSLAPLKYDILLGNYISQIITVLLYPIFVRMRLAIYSGLFTTFTCVLVCSVYRLHRDTWLHIFKGMSGPFNVILSVMMFLPLCCTFIYWNCHLFTVLTMGTSFISVREYWGEFWNPSRGHTPAELAASRRFVGVLKLLGVEDEASLRQSKLSLKEIANIVFVVFLLLALPVIHFFN